MEGEVQGSAVVTALFAERYKLVPKAVTDGRVDSLVGAGEASTGGVF